MAFGVGAAPARSRAVPAALGGIAGDIEAAVGMLARSREALEASGVPLAAVYVEGAVDALRHAEEAIWGCSVDPGGDGGDPLEIGIHRVRMSPGRTDRHFAVDAGREFPSVAAASLGACLLRDADASSLLARDDLAAGLMCAALSVSDWIHLPTGAGFRGDPLAARAVVETVAGRCSVPAWPTGRFRGRIHDGTADVLARLGWRRLSGPALPGARD